MGHLASQSPSAWAKMWISRNEGGMEREKGEQNDGVAIKYTAGSKKHEGVVGRRLHHSGTFELLCFVYLFILLHIFVFCLSFILLACFLHNHSIYIISILYVVAYLFYFIPPPFFLSFACIYCIYVSVLVSPHPTLCFFFGSPSFCLFRSLLIWM